MKKKNKISIIFYTLKLKLTINEQVAIWISQFWYKMEIGIKANKSMVKNP